MSSWRPKCMHPKCQYTVHTDDSWVAKFCCKACRRHYYAGMLNLAQEPNSPPYLETSRIQCPTWSNHGVRCEKVMYYGILALPIVLGDLRRQQDVDESKARDRGSLPYWYRRTCDALMNSRHHWICPLWIQCGALQHLWSAAKNESLQHLCSKNMCELCRRWIVGSSKANSKIMVSQIISLHAIDAIWMLDELAVWDPFQTCIVACSRNPWPMSLW